MLFHCLFLRDINQKKIMLDQSLIFIELHMYDMPWFYMYLLDSESIWYIKRGQSTLSAYIGNVLWTFSVSR